LGAGVIVHQSGDEVEVRVEQQAFKATPKSDGVPLFTVDIPVKDLETGERHVCLWQGGKLRIYYRRNPNSASVVIIVPGSGIVTASGWGFSGQVDYMSWIRDLSRDHSVISFDRVDLDDARWPQRYSALTYEHLLEQLMAVDDWRNTVMELKGQRLILVGHSLGGLLATDLSKKRACTLLVLIGVPGSPLREVLKMQAAQLDRDAPGPTGDHWVHKHLNFIKAVEGDEREMEKLSPVEVLAIKQRATMLRSLLPLSCSQMIRTAVAEQILVVGGARDLTVPPSEVRALYKVARETHHTSLVMAENRGHSLEVTGGGDYSCQQTASEFLVEVLKNATSA
jgi:pimeloyl-ACP methyl ester carboxylesterase